MGFFNFVAACIIMIIIFGFYYGVTASRAENKKFQQKYSKYVGMGGFFNTRLNTFISSDKRTIEDLKFFKFPIFLQSCIYCQIPVLLPAQIETITRVPNFGGKGTGTCSLKFDRLISDFTVLYCSRCILVVESPQHGEAALVKDPEKNYAVGQVVTLKGIVRQNTFVWTL